MNANNREVEEVVIKFDVAMQSFLERRGYENFAIEKMERDDESKFDFIQITHISYDRERNLSDINLIDFQQILSAASSCGGKFAYLIDSDIYGVKLYLGISKENNTNKNEFLNETFRGVYPGSSVDSISDNPLTTSLQYSKAMLGVPSLKRDSDKQYKQSLEKIIFPLSNKRFRILLVAESYERSTIYDIINNLLELGSEIHSYVKQSKNRQNSFAEQHGSNISNTTGNSISNTTGTSESEANTISKSEADTQGSGRRSVLSSAVGAGATAIGGLRTIVPGFGNVIGAGIGAMLANSIGNSTTSNSKTNTTLTSTTRTNSISKSETLSSNESQTIGINKSQTKTTTLGITYEELNKSAQYCEKLIEKYIDRFQKGLNHGMWNVSLYIQSDDISTLSQVEHTLKSVYSGDESFYEPIRFSNIFESNIYDMETLPMLYAKKYENPLHTSFSGFSTALNTEELSLLSAMPNRDIQGVQVSQNANFGLTQSEYSDKGKYIEIGNVLHRGELTKHRFRISLDAINHHIFVSGITGSGKSNSIKNILNKLQSDGIKKPFLVIEPAKSEYKCLINEIKDLQIFSPGSHSDVLRLNPFVFEKESELTSHVDMLKTTFVAAFPMEGPMPYILESALHKIYRDKGWNFENETHPLFTDSKSADYNKKSLLFPTMRDLYEVIDLVVAQSGYANELDSNLKAALKTRINNLTLGVKGKIYNTRHCFSAEILFTKPTIIELSCIVDDCEKSFLMGILLHKLYQYRQRQGDSNNILQHVCVIEEAHRLLPNITLESKNDEANPKGAAVQVFINMLAEIRSYGEGLVIADQIVSKLHRDVVKNTGTKIIHRTMDKEDRDIIGHSINLKEEQILDIATLKAGNAIVHNNEVHEAFMVKIDKIDNNKIDESVRRDFYKKFLESNDKYQYEYLFEKSYNLPFAVNLIDYIADSVVLSKRKILLLALFNSILLDKSITNIMQCCDDFKALLKGFKYNDSDGVQTCLDSEKLNRASCYLFIETFKDFAFLNNPMWYKKIDSYKDIIECICDLLLHTSKTEEVEVCKNDMLAYFQHRHIKLCFPSMESYKRDNVDYTLLILEHMNLYDNFRSSLSLHNNMSAKEHYSDIVKKHFNINDLPQGLLQCLVAIRSGDTEVDISKF